MSEDVFVLRPWEQKAGKYHRWSNLPESYGPVAVVSAVREGMFMWHAVPSPRSAEPIAFGWGRTWDEALNGADAALWRLGWRFTPEQRKGGER